MALAKLCCEVWSVTKLRSHHSRVYIKSTLFCERYKESARAHKGFLSWLFWGWWDTKPQQGKTIIVLVNKMSSTQSSYVHLLSCFVPNWVVIAVLSMKEIKSSAEIHATDVCQCFFTDYRLFNLHPDNTKVTRKFHVGSCVLFWWIERLGEQ